MSIYQRDASDIDSICHKIIYGDSICTPEASEYGYNVKLAPGIIFTALFAIIAFIHLGQVIRYRKRALYMILAIICAGCEAGGWGARIYSSFDEFNFGGYVAQLVLLIISPVFISAATYVIFCQIMDQQGHQWSRIPRKWYIRTFVAGDVFSLVIQAAGGGLSATADTVSGADSGKSIMIAGVVVQVVVTCIFTVLLIDYLIRRSMSNASTLSRPTKILFTAVLVTTFAVFVRCIFRVIEMSQGWKGYLATHEIYLICFDGIPLILATLATAIVHPGRFLAVTRDVDEVEKGSLASQE